MKSTCLNILNKTELLVQKANRDYSTGSIYYPYRPSDSPDIFAYYHTQLESSNAVTADAEFIIEICRVLEGLGGSFSFFPLKVPILHIQSALNNNSTYILTESNADLCTPVRKSIYDEILSEIAKLEVIYQ